VEKVRRYTKYFTICGRIVKLHVAVYDRGYLALNSGKPYQDVQYLLMDYDEFNPIQEAQGILEEYGLRRGLVIESTLRRYQFASFSPLPVSVIADIYFHSHCDKRHASQLLSRGCVGIRVSRKDGVKPRVIKALKNYKGTNFYNYNAEKAYRKTIDQARDEQLGKSDEYMELDMNEE
jgi:hypothetical protein